MKRVLFVLLFCVTNLISYSQNKEQIISSWDKIIVYDTYWGWSQFSNQFQLKRSDYLLTTLNLEDTITRSIDPALIDELLNSLHTDSLIRYDPLRMFGRDSLWLINNAQQLWNSYLGKREEPAEIDSLAVQTIRNYKKVKWAAWFMQGSQWTDDYPYAYVGVISGADTLHIYSDGQYPYMLPWKVGDQPIYNARTSAIVAQLLPDGVKSNKSRLAGERFDFYLRTKFMDSLEIVSNFSKPKRGTPGNLQHWKASSLSKMLS
jgi:hypothetical protein